MILTDLDEEVIYSTLQKIIRVELEEFRKNFQPPNVDNEEDEYITRRQAGKILKVSINTIDKYLSEKILVPHRFGGIIRLKRSEVFNSKKTKKC